MRKLYSFLMLVIAVMLISISALSYVKSVNNPIQGQPEPAYTVKNEGGYVCVYNFDDGQLLKKCDIYTHLLPEADIEQLRLGITVYTDEELQHLLEDFGL